jgi:hypothetical protein
MKNSSKYTFTASGYKVSSIEEASEISPATVSEIHHPQRSDRYSFLSTTKLIVKLQELGWEITHVNQSGKSKFARHTIRMTHPSMKKLDLRHDDVMPQIIIDNSHDGLTQAMIHMGIFRVISKTGLIASVSGLSTSFKFKHIGLEGKEIEELMAKISEQYSKLVPRILEMMNLQLSEEQKYDFAVKAIAAREPWRFVKPTEDGKEILTDKIERLNNIPEILTPSRDSDKGDSLWQVFNVIHEKLVEGGYNRLSDKGRASKTRPIAIPSRNVGFNKELWGLADSFISIQ